MNLNLFRVLWRLNIVGTFILSVTAFKRVVTLELMFTKYLLFAGGPLDNILDTQYRYHWLLYLQEQTHKFYWILKLCVLHVISKKDELCWYFYNSFHNIYVLPIFTIFIILCNIFQGLYYRMSHMFPFWFIFCKWV